MRLRVALALVAGLLSAAPAAAGEAQTSSVRNCVKPFVPRMTLSNALMSCIGVQSIRTTATLQWTTCPSTPSTATEPYCSAGSSTITFRSRRRRSAGANLSIYQAPRRFGAGYYTPGRGRFNCSTWQVDLGTGQPVPDSTQSGSVAVRRIEAFLIPASARTMKVGSIIAPFNMAHNLLVCRYGFVIGEEQADPGWPGKVVSDRVLFGRQETVSGGGRLTTSQRISDPPDWNSATRFDRTVTWKNTSVTIVSLR